MRLIVHNAGHKQRQIIATYRRMAMAVIVKMDNGIVHHVLRR